MMHPGENITGLTSAEVEERIKRGERNQHTARPTRSYGQIIRANVFSLYNIILLASFLALLILRGPGSAIFPAAIVVVNMVLGLVQEIRAKRALDRLATLSVHNVAVRRDGASSVIPIEDIVQGDVIELRPGDSVVVDGPVLASDSLEIDESQLTGESEYVPKQPGDRITSGSYCVSGTGLMEAASIGSGSYVNNLADVARGYKNVRTPLEAQLDALVEILVVIMVFLAPLTLVGGDLRHLSLPDSVENLVNLISSLVPQGLLVFVTISFAYGVLNISRFRALIQRPNAIELMGHITCLCADKTGTLTANLLSIQGLLPVGGATAQSVSQRLATFAAAVSWRNRTVAAIAAHVGQPPEQPAKLTEVPFSSQRRWSSVTLASGETLMLGAPEVLLADSGLHSEVQRLSREGLRVLAFATSREKPNLQTMSLPDQRECMALIALEDVIRPDMAATLREFAEQGIAIKIISGDSPETVQAIARRAGMNADIVLTGSDIEKLDPEVLSRAASETSLFARVAPQTKRLIVAALRRRGPVAMIGDGVNDVPALKQASLAIAMNDGAQIAKDVSDIILLDNAFSTLPKAFFEGREITQRLYGIAKIHLGKVVYLTILFVLAAYAGLPWPANLLQTSWLSLMTLTLPAMLIIFRVLPIPTAENRPGDVLRYLLTWGGAGAAALIILDVAVLAGLKEPLGSARAAVVALAGLYNSLVLWDIYHVRPFSPKTLARNPKPALAGFVFGLAAVLLPSYFLSSALGFAPLTVPDVLLIVALLFAAYAAVRVMMRGKAVDPASGAGGRKSNVESREG